MKYSVLILLQKSNCSKLAILAVMFFFFLFLRTCHLAGKLLKHIIQQGDFDEHLAKPSEKDILCVEIAGLCHDLGNNDFNSSI